MITLTHIHNAPSFHTRPTTQVQPEVVQQGDQFIPSSGVEPRADLQFKEAVQKWGAQQTSVKENQETHQVEERVQHFKGREGYDVNFLGKPLPLPKLAPEQQARVAPLIGKPNESELKYTHFSVVVDKERRQPMLTATNIDGSQLKRIPRSRYWSLDGRIAREHQLGNEAYISNPIDRGHQVRRADPAWGPKAKQASDDTFVYTNASLQHERLNQGEWLKLEDHILNTARQKGVKMTVLTGPVFAKDDPEFDNNGRLENPAKIPQEYWKVVAWNDPEEGLKGSAFVVSQKDWIDPDGPYMSDIFTPGKMSVYQVPIEQLEKSTGLEFGLSENVVSDARRLTDATDSVLPF